MRVIICKSIQLSWLEVEGKANLIHFLECKIVQVKIILNLKGVKYKIVRGALDCQGVVGRTQGRSK